jgi:uncharacterized protein YbjT (DUF2867 family)
MDNKELNIVTGAFGYTGRYITQKLLQMGRRVKTLTNSIPKDDPFDGRVEALPLAFDDPDKLSKSLEGVGTLYNTYWVRFNHAHFSHAQAVENTRILFDAARKADVRRIVHVSITNPSEDSQFEYFRGKAVLEKYLKDTGISYAILRPAVMFGNEDILINNIAWMLRRFPVFGLFGDGEYGIQPIHVEDFAEIAVEHGGGTEDIIVNTIGPEAFTYRGLVETIGGIIGCRRPMMKLKPCIGLYAGKLAGILVRDVVITHEEIGGLMAGLLAVNTGQKGATKLTDWAFENRETLGKFYASELARRQVQ